MEVKLKLDTETSKTTTTQSFLEITFVERNSLVLRCIYLSVAPYLLGLFINIKAASAVERC